MLHSRLLLQCALPHSQPFYRYTHAHHTTAISAYFHEYGKTDFIYIYKTRAQQTSTAVFMCRARVCFRSFIAKAKITPHKIHNRLHSHPKHIRQRIENIIKKFIIKAVLFSSSLLIMKQWTLNLNEKRRKYDTHARTRRARAMRCYSTAFVIININKIWILSMYERWIYV